MLVNIAQLRRSPADPVPRAARKARAPALAAPEPSPPSPEAAPADLNADVLILREEVRKLREQLAISRASHELEKSRLGLSFVDTFEQPESREFAELWEKIEAFIEIRRTEGVDPEGRPVTFQKQVLTPENRKGVIRVLADYAALDGAARSAFQGMAEVAIDRYRRITEEHTRDLHEVQKAGQNDEFFEDGQVRMRACQDRTAQRYNRWGKEHVQPLCDLLDRRDGVRPALLRRNLSEILSQLSFADER